VHTKHMLAGFMMEFYDIHLLADDLYVCRNPVGIIWRTYGSQSFP
jgi:hypothetical protein